MTEINHLNADLEFVEKALEIVHYQLYDLSFYIFNIGMLGLILIAGGIGFYATSDKFQAYLAGKGRLAACAVAVLTVGIIAALTTLSVSPAKTLKLSQVAAATFKVSPEQEYKKLFGTQTNVSIFRFEMQKSNLVTRLIDEKERLEWEIKMSKKVEPMPESEVAKLRTDLTNEKASKNNKTP